MSLPFAVRSMMSSLKTNNRRKERVKMDQPTGIHIEKTEYDFAEVSEEEKNKVVQQILKKRRFVDSGKGLVIAVLSIVTAFFLFMISAVFM